MPSGTPQDAADQVKNMVREGAQKITDNLTFKPQRQAISNFVDSAEKKVRSYLPGNKTSSGPVTSKQKPVWGDPKSMKKGGVVKKTGLIKMHAGERVIPKKSASKKGK